MSAFSGGWYTSDVEKVAALLVAVWIGLSFLADNSKLVRGAKPSPVNLPPFRPVLFQVLILFWATKAAAKVPDELLFSYVAVNN